MSIAQQQIEFDDVDERLTPSGEFDGVPSFVLDVPETIPQLGYGSHQFFRYYGKFPSVVGAEIVKRLVPSPGPVLDCYAGSGTTLVEAQHGGLISYGMDINPLAVLACNVKTGYYGSSALAAVTGDVLGMADDLLRTDAAVPLPKAARLDKWFSPEAQKELAAVRAALVELPASTERRFLTLAFLAIVRRVSVAYDGEVRPHVNLDKRQRSPLEAFRRKVHEMTAALPEVDSLRPVDIHSRSIVGDNREPGDYASLLEGSSPVLLVAHPPYLNSFNYLQVFGLEFMWADGLTDVWADTPFDAKQLRAREHKAWPATDAKLVENYYRDFQTTMSAACDTLATGARLAVVIGDATIRGELEPVHKRMWNALKELGLEPSEIWFRTTHYGIGKYAYRHRADYHGEAEKRDAVLVFAKS